MQPVGQAILVLFCLLLPLLIYGLAIHWLERWIQGHLSQWFGWRAVLVTGWLGTPIHELSHALACLVFGHRIDEMRLFDPDIESGRLGYIRHSYHKGQWWAEIGNVFIGTAPLFGGSLMLMGLFAWFYPQITLQLMDSIKNSQWETLSGGMVAAAEQVRATLETLIADSNWLSWKPWLFLYFALCIGSHSAPSRSDYAGALKGSLMLAGILLPAVSVWMVFVPEPLSLVKTMIATLLPLGTMMLLVLALTSLVGLIVVVVSLLLGSALRRTSQPVEESAD